MERLTQRNESNTHYYYPLCFEKCNGLGSSKTCNDCSLEGDITEKLGQYEDAEEQGLLLRLPCKVGDTVYEISLVEPYRNPAIREMGVVDILLRDDDMYFTLQDLYDENYDNSILSTEFGITVFLTKEEAEQKLAEMKGNKYEVR